MNQVIDLRAFTNSVNLPTLVLVDLQEEYLASSRALAIPNVDAALANCRTALTHARATGIPVAFTRWVGSTFFNPATRFSGWIEGFEPHGSDSIFERKQPSCYTSQHFAEVMAGNSGNFIMAGFAGEAACLSTAIDAFHRGHRVTYLSDASASHGLANVPATEVHSFIGQLMGLWGNVMPTEAWIKTTSRAAAWKERKMLGGKL
ncbi:MAG: isochorismatase family cysteine hydrolase [Hyphomicrobium sp.]